LPWADAAEKPIDIADARRILDEDHYGLDKIKKRILEYLAVRKLNPTGRSPILASSVRPAWARPRSGRASRRRRAASSRGSRWAAFTTKRRYAATAARTSARCRQHHPEPAQGGHAALRADAGRSRQARRRRLSRRPASALLEVLDPEQNATFRDNYLGVPFDLSGVMFICTANVLDTIPGPLRDRMEVIQLPGYTGQEKLQIARRYLVDRQLKATGLSAEQASIGDDVLMAIIDDYTREAGVRNLEREIGNVLRDVAVRIAAGEIERAVIGKDDLARILGPRSTKRRSRCAAASPVWPRVSRGRRSVATSCSSRRRECPATANSFSRASWAT
jgi:ATP-dependent Lon protease